VNGVSFTLRRGECLAIIGRNGSGKSTLLEMITGTLTPSRGSVRTHGRVSALLELGSGFNPDYTGRQNFRLSAAISGLTESEIDEVEPRVEAFAEIGGFIDEPVRTYSSGMYVRLAFATSVHVRPDLLIVDEALAVGDIFFQQKCMDYILSELGGTTKLLVTHDLASAARLADSVVVMDQGNVVFAGDAFEAIEAYTALSLGGPRSAQTGSKAAQSQRGGPEGDEVGAPTNSDTTTDEPDPDSAAVAIDRSTNPDEFLVRSSSASVVGSEQPAGHEVIAIPGDVVQIDTVVTTFVDVEEPIFGYLIRDRTGHALFGQNSLGSGIMLDALAPGTWRVRLRFQWPEVEAGDFSLVLGLGNGIHPLHHRIIGWAQGVVKISSMPRRPVHGSFNQDIVELSVDAVGRA
jgi:ABC-type polysaccharide/polyol phosphate transport system ATPase subunit